MQDVFCFQGLWVGFFDGALSERAVRILRYRTTLAIAAPVVHRQKYVQRAWLRHHDERGADRCEGF